jgi:hypothetical protein
MSQSLSTYAQENPSLNIHRRSYWKIGVRKFVMDQKIKKNYRIDFILFKQGLQCGVFGVLFTLHLTQYTKCNECVKKTVGVNMV